MPVVVFCSNLQRSLSSLSRNVAPCSQGACMELNELSLVTQCGVNEWGLEKNREKAKPHSFSGKAKRVPQSSLFPHLLLGFNLLTRWFCYWSIRVMLRWKKRNIHFNLRSWSSPRGAAIKTKHETQNCCCCKPSMCSILNFSTFHSTFFTSFFHKVLCFQNFISMALSFVTLAALSQTVIV